MSQCINCIADAVGVARLSRTLQHDATMLFDPCSPEGHHCLDLSQPYQRAIAMSLYRKCCESGPDVENWKVHDV